MVYISLDEYQRLAFENLKADQKALCQKLKEAIEQEKELKTDAQKKRILPWIEKAQQEKLLEVRYHGRQQTTLLCLAIRKRYVSIAWALLNEGADPASVCWEGSNALKLATDALNRSINKRPDPDSDETWSAEDEDFDASMSSMIFLMVEKMTEKGNIKALAGYSHASLGQSPLHDLIDCKKWSLVKQLINNGADLDQVDSNDKTARAKLNNAGVDNIPHASKNTKR